MSSGLLPQTRVLLSCNILPCFIKSRLPYLTIEKDEMKKQNSIFIALAIILLASLACNIGGTAPATEAGQEPVATSEQTNLVATTVPSQEAVAIDGPPGPETIDLTNPALYITSSEPAYKFDTNTKFTGVDSTGTAKEVSLLMTEETQTLPQKSQRFLVVVTGGEGSAETVVIGDQVYTVFQGACYPSPLSSVDEQSLSEGMPKLQDGITGHAQRVESGIDVNGFVTDKYALTSENMNADDELMGAFVYVVRDGGFITLFEMQGRSKTDYQGLDPNQFTDITTAYDYIPVEDGSLDIAIPVECNNPAGLTSEFPVMDGATNLNKSPEFVTYQIEKPRSEVANFYRAEMPNRGWTLTDEGIGGGIFLVFTKDGKNVRVTVAGNSSDTSASVAITEE